MATSLEYPMTCVETPLTVDIVAAGNTYQVLKSRDGICKHTGLQTMMGNVIYNVIYNTCHKGLQNGLQVSVVY